MVHRTLSYVTATEKRKRIAQYPTHTATGKLKAIDSVAKPCPAGSLWVRKLTSFYTVFAFTSTMCFLNMLGRSHGCHRAVKTPAIPIKS